MRELSDTGATLPTPGVGRRQRVQSAETGLAILKALVVLGGSASLTAIAQHVGESAAKVHRYLTSFVQEGFVAQHPATHHYYLGPESIRLGQAALRQCDPVRLGEGALFRLRESLAVTSFIAVMGNQGPTVLRMEEPSLPVTVNIRPGSVLPLPWSATGQVFLAFSDDSKLLQQAEEAFVSGSAEQRAFFPGSQPLLELQRQVRERGLATVHDTLLRGISAVAAPVKDASGHVCAVLTVLGASSGIDVSPQGAIARAVVREAAAISAAMGHPAT